MSAKVTKKTVSTLSEKFVKELEKFFEWCVKNEYILVDESENEIEWNTKLLKKFEEPGRNKIEGYLKELKKNYSIKKNDEEIDDVKLLCKEYKEKSEKSPKKGKKETEEKSEKSPKKGKKETEEKKGKKVKEDEEEEVPKKKGKKVKEDEEEEVSKKEVPKKKGKKVDEETDDIPKSPKRKGKKVESEVKLDMSLKTNEVYLIKELDYWTNDLVQVFGKPKKTKELFEWKIEIGDSTYSIRNNIENGEEFEESTWYLYKVLDEKENIKILSKYITDLKPKEEDKGEECEDEGEDEGEGEECEDEGEECEDEDEEDESDIEELNTEDI